MKQEENNELSSQFAEEGPDCQRPGDYGNFQCHLFCVYPSRWTSIRSEPSFDLLYAHGAALLCGPIYLLMVAKVQKRWSVTILGIIMGIIWFATGMHWAFSLGYIGMGIIADLVAGAGHYRNKAINLLSYMLISLGGIYTYVVFFIDPEGWASTMLENGTEQSYIDTMSASAPSWLLAVIIVGTLVIAAFSGWIGGKMLKKQFEKAGITA